MWAYTYACMHFCVAHIHVYVYAHQPHTHTRMTQECRTRRQMRLGCRRVWKVTASTRRQVCVCVCVWVGGWVQVYLHIFRAILIHPLSHVHVHALAHEHTHTHASPPTHTRHLDLGRRNDPRGTRGAHTRALTHTPSLSCVLCVCVRVCVRARTHTRHCHLGGSPDPRGVVDEGPHRVVLGVVTRGVAGLWARVCSRFGLRVCGWRDASVCVCVCDCV